MSLIVNILTQNLDNIKIMKPLNFNERRVNFTYLKQNLCLITERIYLSKIFSLLLFLSLFLVVFIPTYLFLPNSSENLNYFLQHIYFYSLVYDSSRNGLIKVEDCFFPVNCSQDLSITALNMNLFAEGRDAELFYNFLSIFIDNYLYTSVIRITLITSIIYTLLIVFNIYMSPQEFKSKTIILIFLIHLIPDFFYRAGSIAPISFVLLLQLIIIQVVHKLYLNKPKLRYSIIYISTLILIYILRIDQLFFSFFATLFFVISISIFQKNKFTNKISIIILSFLPYLFIGLFHYLSSIFAIESLTPNQKNQIINNFYKNLFTSGEQNNISFSQLKSFFIENLYLIQDVVPYFLYIKYNLVIKIIIFSTVLLPIIILIGKISNRRALIVLWAVLPLIIINIVFNSILLGLGPRIELRYLTCFVTVILYLIIYNANFSKLSAINFILLILFAILIQVTISIFTNLEIINSFLILGSNNIILILSFYLAFSFLSFKTITYLKS